eukprot:1209-Pelagococcus_subviridis.AAC.4
MRNRNHANRSARSNGTPASGSPPTKIAGATSASVGILSGALSAASSATGAPAECPRTHARVTPSASMSASVSSAWPSGVYTKCAAAVAVAVAVAPAASVAASVAASPFFFSFGRLESPYGGRSNAIARTPASLASLGRRLRNENSEPFAPWRHTTASMSRGDGDRDCDCDSGGGDDSL